MEITTMASVKLLSKSEAKECIDKFASNLYDVFGMRASALVSAMAKRLSHDEHERERLEAELESLSSGYNKYMDVLGQIKTHERSIDKLKAIIGYGASPFISLLGYTQPESPDDVEAEKKGRELRRNLELWEAIEQYLRFTPEAKVRDVLDFMETVEICASRQSIEAAIKAHPRIFRIQKKKREKYVSLK
jgi:hypothetical protein